MRGGVMRLTLKALTSCLLDRFPSGGKPFVYDLEAECLQIIETVADGDGPGFSKVEHLTEDSTLQIYEWLLTSLANNNLGDRAWIFAAHVLRLYVIDHVTELLRRVQSPPQTIGHKPVLPSAAKDPTVVDPTVVDPTQERK